MDTLRSRILRRSLLCWVGVLSCLLTCAGCLGSSAGTSSPATLGATESAFNRAWHVGPTSTACVKENLALTCSYIVNRAHVTVVFDQHLHAQQITVDAKHRAGVNTWAFLNRLVPASDAKIGCRYIPHSFGGGTAHACLYKAPIGVIVAYFPQATDPTFGGIVTIDYAGYGDIER